MAELVFDIVQTVQDYSGFSAECLTEDIVTQGDFCDALKANVREAVAVFFGDRATPASRRPHLVRNEVLSVA